MSRPVYVDLVNAVLPRRWLPFRLSSPEQLFEHATRRAGVSGIAPDPLVWAGFTTLFDSLRREALLHPLGEAVMAFNLIQLMESRLRLDHDAKAYPAIAAEPINAPVVITGLPRTGSTLLHELLSMDLRFAAPRSWQVMFPSPPPDAQAPPIGPHSIARRIGRTNRRFLAVHVMNPHFRQVHDLKAEFPQECICIQATAFLGAQFITSSYVPAYHAWWESVENGQSYDYHRRFLQQLQFGSPRPRQWLLKAPSHLLSINHLVDAYPDVRLIQTHRDVEQALGSIASLQRHLYTAFSTFADNRAIGALVSDIWERGLARMARLRDERPALTSRIADVDYATLTSNPMAVVNAIYRQFGWSLDDSVRGAMRAYLAAHPQHKHGRHAYSAREFGLAGTRKAGGMRG